MEMGFFTIGQTSAICGLSVQTLRYYDKIGLLNPSFIDRDSGYRYYSRSDMIRVRIIQNLKELGCSLQEIELLLDRNDRERMADLFEKKAREYEDKIEEFNRMREKIVERSKQMEELTAAAKGNTRFEESIAVKFLPERKVLFQRCISGCDYESLVMRFYELDTILNQQALKPAGNRLAVYHDYLHDFEPQHCDLEVGVPIEEVPEESNPWMRCIESGLYATATFHGPYTGQCETLVRWIRNNGYQILGPGIEVYVNSFMNTPFDSNYITEVQFQIEKL